ncbi:MAG: hypothetical protein ACI8UO_006440 [Verrucomicrobiales bacterium]|jgi:hypothetical protein
MVPLRLGGVRVFGECPVFKRKEVYEVDLLL